MKTKEQLLKRAWHILESLDARTMYPRTALEIPQMVTFEGVTWREIGITAEEMCYVFEKAWKAYAPASAEHTAFVLSDFSTQVGKSIAPEHTFGVDAEIYHFPNAVAA